MKIVVGADHVGYELKRKVLDKLERDGHEVIDVGCFSPDKVDFPDIARALCAAILNKKAQRGIMLCGSGVGAAIACNKIRGIRASVVHDIYTAHQCVEHDDVQVMAVGTRIVGETLALELMDRFLEAVFFDSEDFRIRLKKLEDIEKS